MQTALLIGSTGLIGRALLPKLSAQFKQVYAASRTSIANLPSNVSVLTTDFSAPLVFPKCDVVFCALGTTIKVAGSEKDFYAVDYELVVKAAQAAKAAGAHRMAVVSALGASPKSRVFYNRTKGQMEDSLKHLHFDMLAIARPSFLAGNRASLGQPSRPGEALALAIARPLAGLIPEKYRPISAHAVAQALIDALISEASLSDAGGVVVLESDKLQEWMQ
jgi:uncharacterized protein YbjT (DUF2867 family)